MFTSSRLKSTPPIGAPKATDTPAAAAADKTYSSQKQNRDGSSAVTLVVIISAIGFSNYYNLIKLCAAIEDFSNYIWLYISKNICFKRIP